MAYGQKYSVTYATRADKDVELKIWQDGYVGSITSLQGVALNLQYIPNSDDVYEPIMASQLGITIDFTDNESDMIDFTNINDRYTYVEMYVDSVIEWVGFVLNDNVQISYTTGRKLVFFNAVDGLGMLKGVTFEPIVGNYGVNDIASLITILRTCFNKIGFKNNRNIITLCSYFANGMSDRGSASWRDPFAQTYMNYRTFLNDAYTYTNCFDIISNIAKSFELVADTGGTGWGTDVWGSHNWGTSNTQVVIPAPQDTIRWASIYKTGRNIQIEVIQNATEVNFEIADMKLTATLQPEGSLSSTLRI